jgi:hypothetical protein
VDPPWGLEPQERLKACTSRRLGGSGGEHPGEVGGTSSAGTLRPLHSVWAVSFSRARDSAPVHPPSSLQPVTFRRQAESGPDAAAVMRERPFTRRHHRDGRDTASTNGYRDQSGALINDLSVSVHDLGAGAN